jgi:hypothetical protein
MNPNILIDMKALSERVERLIDVDTDHLSYPEVIKLLCDELEIAQQDIAYLRRVYVIE